MAASIGMHDIHFENILLKNTLTYLSEPKAQWGCFSLTHVRLSITYRNFASCIPVGAVRKEHKMLEELKSRYEKIATLHYELDAELHQLEEDIADLEQSAVSLEDYVGLKDDIADYIIAVKRDDQQGVAIMERYLMAYFAKDERKAIDDVVKGVK